MTEQFREALDAFLRGDLPQAELDAELQTVLARQPDAAPELLAIVQARYQSGHMSAEVFAALGEKLGDKPAANSDSLDDRTRLQAHQTDGIADDRTRVAGAGPGEAPTVVTPRRDEGDGPATGSTSPSGPTGGTGSTGASWGDPALWADGPSEPPQAGMTLKNRFVLESVIGRGGMGVVFKARDLRKEEAQDRNPYLAVKVLNEEFKRHPDSLKALQRESRKAQNLAHPNIVNVFDFDRDGATVYMTMEYLEGEPLDRFIKRDRPQGMPLKEALPIIMGMGQALAYAHQKGVVHSDFKPGNVFLTRDGTVKVFDFGIAQATKHTGADAGEQTLFDAGTLGALTPSYASVEMLEGGDPDPRDDIYALACVAYQLLTGRHPFDKRPATEARDRKLAPRPVPGLGRRQWRTLLQGLAFERSARSPDVEAFLAGFGTAKRSRIALIGGGALVLAVGVVIAALLPGYLQQRRVTQVVDQIERGNPAQIAEALKTVRGFGPQARSSVMQQARDRILGYYRRQVDGHFNPAKDRYDYPGAQGLLQQARTLYPDSAQVQDLADQTRDARNQLLNSLNARFNKALDAGHLLPTPDKDDVADILDVVAQVDPGNKLLSDPRLTIAYAKQANEAAGSKRYSQALRVVNTGLKRFPGNARLTGLQDKIRQQLHFQQVQGQISQLETQIKAALGKLRTVADIAPLHDKVLKLEGLYPADPLLEQVQSDLQRVVGGAFDRFMAKHDQAQARQLLDATAELLAIKFTRARVRQWQAAQPRGAGQPPAPAVQNQVSQDKAKVAALMDKPEFTTEWRARMRQTLRALAGLLPAADSWFAQTRRQVAQLYLQRARKLGGAQRFDQAGVLLAEGEGFAALPAFKQARTALAQAKAKMEAQARAEQLQARVAGQKQTLVTQATANDVKGARRTLAALQKELSADDPFLQRTAPQALGEAYLRLARQKAAEHRYVDAVALLRAGIKEAPKLTALGDALKRYGPGAELESIETALRTGSPGALDALKGKLQQFRSAHPKEYAAAASGLAGIATKRVLQVAASNADLASRLLTSARNLFPADHGLSALRIASSTTPAPTATPASTAHASSPPAGRPCSPDLAGYGRSGRGTCYDSIGSGDRGPLLVVIPAGDGITAPYAISKYEISVSNYDLYCKLSGKCKGISGVSGNLPATDISYQDAQSYAAWLSNRTGFHYAIPTNRQWTHAAKAKGGGSSGDYNCQVRIGGKLIKGFGLVSVKTGQPNGWGLVNDVGNAQEWVKGPKGLEVRGGSYKDSLSQCSVSLTHGSNGKPDKATGFRLVRSLQRAH